VPGTPGKLEKFVEPLAIRNPPFVTLHGWKWTIYRWFAHQKW
jgi:hypothetical protein